MNYYVYILTNKTNRVLYVGVTNDLCGRVWTHKEKVERKSFTARYNINKLIYYEIHEDIYEAIVREKQIKNLVRRKKIELINNFNSEWKDLYYSIC